MRIKRNVSNCRVLFRVGLLLSRDLFLLGKFTALQRSMGLRDVSKKLSSVKSIVQTTPNV